MTTHGHRHAQQGDPTMPTDISSHLSSFDRFATAVSDQVSKAWFFVVCILMVVIWLPSFVLLNIDTWQLIINTLTTIVTFLLVALLQNTQKRADDALQQKLSAIADGLADLMRVLSTDERDLTEDRQELMAAVGLEDRESGD